MRMKRKASAATSQSEEAVAADSSIDRGDGPPNAKRQQTRRSLFVRSLPADCTTETLLNHFSEDFPIKHATAIVDPKTNACRGYGFVTFADAEDAQQALDKFQGSKIGANSVKLSIAEPRKRDAEHKAGKAQDDGSAVVDIEQEPPKLIVRNLPWSVKDKEGLTLLFRSYGKVKFATVPKNKAGKQYGFGIVLLRGRKNAEKAMAGLNGKVIDGRTLAVDWAVNKDLWQQQKDGATEADDEISHAVAVTTKLNAAETIDELSPDEGDDDNIQDSLVEPEELEEGASESDGTVGSEGNDEEATELEDAQDEKDQRPPEDYSVVLFIRNLPFDATDETLRDHFTKFGRLRYARVVYDRETEQSRGTAFVCFQKAEDATHCLKGAPRETLPANAQKNNASSLNNPLSVLQNEELDPSGAYTMDGRVLSLSRAVDKQQAAKLTEANKERRADSEKDRRRMYLLAEGVLPRNSAMYKLLAPGEIAMRDASMKQRKSILQSNPSLHLSLTRLSVRNVPRSITSKDLKQLAREAVVGFAQDVKDGKRQRLSKEELERGGEAMVEAEKLRKNRGVGVVKQAKIVFESREGSKVTEKSGGGRSRGYGFIEYYTHRSALMGLRYLNGHPVEYNAQEAGEKTRRNKDPEAAKKKRLIVEFAIENAQVVNRRRDKEVRARAPEKTTSKGSTKDSNEKAEASAPEKTAAEDKLAKRQRIINRKRAMRRDKRRGASKT